jgi:outer membrane protein OmpA-like peptidoglycan-associated protein
MSIMKIVPIGVTAAAVAVIAAGSVDELKGFFVVDETVAAVAKPTPEQTNAAIAALAAVTAATEAAPPALPQGTSEQLAALLNDTPTPSEQLAVLMEDSDVEAVDVDVTRAQGFATANVAPTTDVTAVAPQEPSAQIGADFFNSAQANLAQSETCANDLRNLASQAKVYFPSGALTGDATGIAQARLIGTIVSGCRGIGIEVQGHSDPSGDPAVNLRLSQERAEAVIARSAAGGLDTSMFVAVGLGSARPSGVTGAEDAAFYDRRVEFEIVEIAQTAAFTAPMFRPSDFANVACVVELQAAVDTTLIAFEPRALTVARDDLDAAIGLAQLATDCPQARLRVIGHHAPESFEDPGTGRTRAALLMTTLVGAGFPSEQIIIASPSDPRPIEGFSNSRVDFDVILEEL